jgi:hypothetical protein
MTLSEPEPSNEYDKDQVVRLRAIFKIDGNLADPTDVALFIQNPHKFESGYYYSSGTVSRISTGTYYRDLTLNDSGIWYYKFVGTGVDASEERSMLVRRSVFP